MARQTSRSLGLAHDQSKDKQRSSLIDRTLVNTALRHGFCLSFLLMVDTDLVIGALVQKQELLAACGQWLQGGRYRLKPIPLEQLQDCWDGLDGMLIEGEALDPEAMGRLRRTGLLLPAVVIGEVTGGVTYHEAEMHLQPDQLEQLPYNLDAAVSRFLQHRLQREGTEEQPPSEHWKLPQRLEGRLGYLGVFYKRDPRLFLRNLAQGEQRELLQSLERSYRDVLLSYFRDPPAANQAIESFVNTAFFSDLPIPKAVEIHMNLVDGWSKQLLLEGHKSEFLQDYRLALLDVMAHLCEMYRRSIPPDGASGHGRLRDPNIRQVEMS
jgi:circadian clock protein KaiA